ncbi:MAG TPA: hypothetical protein PLS93_16360, partial [Accumulibacter sp.]|nr:hypothetical protein [Accumulibacter sp.]
ALSRWFNNKQNLSTKDKIMEAHFETNLGNFKIKLFEDKTPTLVKHFAGLVVPPLLRTPARRRPTRPWTRPRKLAALPFRALPMLPRTQ